MIFRIYRYSTHEKHVTGEHFTLLLTELDAESGSRNFYFFQIWIQFCTTGLDQDPVNIVTVHLWFTARFKVAD